MSGLKFLCVIGWHALSAHAALRLLLALSLLLTPPSGDAARRAVVTPVTISTIAGGGFGANVQVRQAPMGEPSAVVLDPQGRGFYVVDQLNSVSLVRFVNTTANAVTIDGVSVQPGNINLIAGGGLQSGDGVRARDADLAEITGIAVDPSGNALYLAIPAFMAIRVVNVGAQPFTVLGRVIAPSTVGTIAMPEQAEIKALAIHPANRELYFSAGNVVFRLDPNGTAVRFAGGGNPANNGTGDGGPAVQARLVNPNGLAFDSNNNLLIAEGGNPRGQSPSGRVRRVVANGTISSLTQGLDFPVGITVAPNGDAYVAVGNEQRIYRVTPAGGRTAIAGKSTGVACDRNSNPTCGDNLSATLAELSLPDSAALKSVVFAADARAVYLPGFRYPKVRLINYSSGSLTVLGTTLNSQFINSVVGSGVDKPYDGGPAVAAELDAPTGVTVDAAGNLYIADSRDGRLRFVNRTPAPVTLFVSTPFATTVQPGQIVTLNRDAGDTPVDDRITTALFTYPQGLVSLANRGVLIVDSQAGALIKIPPGSVSGRRSGVIRFLNTSNNDVTFFPNGGDAKVVVPPGQIKDLAGVRPPANPQILGDGMSANRVAFFPTDIALDPAGNILIADQGNHRIRRVDAGTAVVSTVYGDGMTSTLDRPSGIAFDNGRLYIADTRNHRILRQNAAAATAFSVIADRTKGINLPRDLAVDAQGKIFIANTGTHQILDLVAQTNELGVTSVVAGTGTTGFAGDGGAGEQAQLSLPMPGTASNDIQLTCNLVALANGDILFTDANNNRIRLLKRVEQPAVATVNSASYRGETLAAESIVAAFGARLATATEVGTSQPLPTTLAGTTVRLRDSAGMERLALLFFVSPAQINYLMPEGMTAGNGTVTVTSGDGVISTGTVTMSAVAPGLFAANANGRGVPAAVVVRVKANGEQTFEVLAEYDAAQMRFVPLPIDLGPTGEQVFLILYGTGMRFRSSLAGVSARVGNEEAEVSFVGAVPGFVGLDQVNLRVPRSLVGRGAADVMLTIDGKPTNTVTVQIK